MSMIPEGCHPVNARTQFESAVLEAEASLRDSIAQKLTLVLIAIVAHVLNRPYHRRRARVSKRVRGEGQCYRCRSRRSRCFTRNGFRRRQLLTR